MSHSETLFGLPISVDEARVQVVPIPFEATVSFRRGTAGAPSKILEASWQVDLHDLETTDAWRAGIAMHPERQAFVDWNREATFQAQQALEVGALDPDAARAAVNATMVEMNRLVESETDAIFDGGAIPAILGGDHSVSLGAMRAAARRYPGLGILHIDAHADLREAYQGFSFSHASILHNVLAEAPDLRALVQVGIRDLSEAEWRLSEADARVTLCGWPEAARRLDTGEPWASLMAEYLAPLPEDVWVTFDIDGLDPALCPGTGTPVPGGLSWDQATGMIAALARSGRRIVGFDVCEIGTSTWDATVGARLLYKLACWAIRSSERG